MVPKRTDHEIRAIIRSHFEDASGITELTGGLASQTFAFEVNGKRYVFKIGARKELHEKEQWVYSKYHDVLPLRRVIEIDDSEDQSPYAIYDFVDGVKLFDLDSQELVDIIPSVLQNLSILKSIEVTDKDGFGRFDGTGNASYPSWRDFVEAVCNEKIYDWSEVEKRAWMPN